MAKVLIFTDGGAEPNPGYGGWGAVLEYEGHRKELHVSAQDVTNNQMEITGITL